MKTRRMQVCIRRGYYVTVDGWLYPTLQTATPPSWLPDTRSPVGVTAKHDTVPVGTGRALYVSTDTARVGVGDTRSHNESFPSALEATRVWSCSQRTVPQTTLHMRLNGIRNGVRA
jgi:hypothetical protein